MTASLKIYNENFSMRYLKKTKRDTCKSNNRNFEIFFNEITKGFFSVSPKITPQLSEQILIH